MDVIIETQKGLLLEIEVGYFDTVLEIKEKIEKYKKIPVSKQTLILNGKVLEDNDDVQKCDVYHGTRILLADSRNQPEKPWGLLQSQQPVSKKMQLLIKFPGVRPPQVHTFLMEPNNTIKQLKEKITEMLDGVPASRLVLHTNGNAEELQDNRTLHDYQLTDGSEVLVSACSSPTTSRTGSKKIMIVVMPVNDLPLKIPVEVNSTDKVQVLNGELEKLQQRFGFQLPEEFFYIHDQDVLNERQSFQRNNIRHGDMISVFPGRVTRGS